MTILILDDSVPVLQLLKSMSISIGFDPSNIVTSRSSKEGISLTSKQRFDVILCDYNFGFDLNGKQLLEELRYQNSIDSRTIFIFITGENNIRVVNSIIDLEPDDYIIKPFKVSTLKARLRKTIIKKKSLNELYDIEDNYQLGLQKCDELEKKYPKLSLVINKFRCKYLSKLELYDQAKENYQTLYDSTKETWVISGLANTLSHLNEDNSALQVLNNNKNKVLGSSQIQSEYGCIYLKNKNIDKALSHFENAKQLTSEDSEKELLLSQLLWAQGEYEKSLDRLIDYTRINKGTYRDNHFASLKLLRAELFAAGVIGNKSRINLSSKIENTIKRFYKQEKITSIAHELHLCAIHLNLLKGQLKNASLSLLKMYQKNSIKHFGGLIHMAWLLYIFSYNSRCINVIEKCRESVNQKQSDALLHCKITMIESLLDNIKLHSGKLNSSVAKRRSALESKDYQTILDCCISMIISYPILKEPAVIALKLLNRYLPKDLSTNEVEALFFKIKCIIFELHSEKEINDFNLIKLYHGAKANLLRHHTIKADHYGEDTFQYIPKIK